MSFSFRSAASLHACEHDNLELEKWLVNWRDLKLASSASATLVRAGSTLFRWPDKLSLSFSDEPERV